MYKKKKSFYTTDRPTTLLDTRDVSPIYVYLNLISTYQGLPTPTPHLLVELDKKFVKSKSFLVLYKTVSERELKFLST